MKLTLSWLKEYLETDANLEEICTKLTEIGLEVEEVKNQAEALSYFSIAQIIEANKHPDANKLQICKVDVGTKEPLQIICGAANARAGIKVVYAPIGSIIPTNGLQIKKSAIRGVESHGMLCSAAELGIGADSNGIIEIDQNAEIGTKITEFYNLNDAIIEVNVTPNRGDCLGVYGIARDLAAAGIGSLKEPKIKEVKSNFTSPITVNISDKNCPYFSGRYIKNITNKESPKWLKERLEAIGLNSISAIVDITNYVLYSLNQPLHAYDADKISGNISIRSAKNEAFKSLKELDYKLEDNELVIADDKEILCLAGVIGGLNSACALETKNIFLEAAYFDSNQIAKQGRKLNILSDSRYRFERGTDIEGVTKGLDMATNLILEICGGEVSEITYAGNNKAGERKVNFDFGKVKKLLGIEIEAEKIKEILTNLEFTVNGSEVIIPSFRSDISVTEDLVEEVIRIYGYNQINVQKLEISEIKKDHDKSVLAAQALRNLGLNEIISWSFINHKIANLFAKNKDELFIQNPISLEMDYMRPSLLPGLILAARKNRLRGVENISFFEVGKVFLGLSPEQQINMIAGIRIGKNKERSFYNDERKFDILDAKKDLFEVVEAYGLSASSLQFSSEVPSYYHPFKSGVAKLGKNIIGYFGELHPALNKKLDLKEKINIFELFADNLPQTKKSNSKKAFVVSDLQAVNRDFAFILDEKIAIGDLIKLVEKQEKELVSKVNIFDIYRGDKIDKNKKSVAFEIEIQPKIKTLTSDEIDQISNKIINAVISDLGGVLRDGN